MNLVFTDLPYHTCSVRRQTGLGYYAFLKIKVEDAVRFMSSSSMARGAYDQTFCFMLVLTHEEKSLRVQSTVVEKKNFD